MRPEDIIKVSKNSLNIYSFTAEALEKLIAAIQAQQPCPTCEALARTVMMDQTAHDTRPQPAAWVGLTDEDIEEEFGFIDELLRDCVHRTETKLKEKNT